MKQLYFSFFTVLLLGLPAQLSAKDIVYYALDNKGESHYINKDLIPFETNVDLRVAEHEAKYYLGRLKAKPSMQAIADYTLRLMRLGKKKEALEIYKKLSSKFPKEHVFHAYLSMAHELNGDNQNALKHAKKALQLNPYTNGESEWITIAVLEAKIALEKNPDYLQNHSVLSLTNEQRKADKVRNQIMFQLKERFPYYKAPDPVMASLLKSLGDCYAESQSYEYAGAFYEIAVYYYGSDDPELSQKMKGIRALQGQYANTTVVPKEEHTGPDFAIVKVKKVDYRELLLRYDDHTVNWKNLETDPKKLLVYVKDLKSTMTAVAQEVPEVEEEDNEDGFTGVVILAIMVALSPVIIYLRRRMKNE